MCHKIHSLCTYISASITAESRRKSQSEESIAPNMRQELEQTRTTVDRLERQMSSLSNDIAYLTGDVKQILRLLRTSLSNSPGDSPSRSPDSPKRDRVPSFSSSLPYRRRGHRDSVSSAPGLTTGSLIGILKPTGDRTSPSLPLLGGNTRVDFSNNSQTNPSGATANQNTGLDHWPAVFGNDQNDDNAQAGNRGDIMNTSGHHAEMSKNWGRRSSQPSALFQLSFPESDDINDVSSDTPMLDLSCRADPIDDVNNHEEEYDNEAASHLPFLSTDL